MTQEIITALDVLAGPNQVIELRIPKPRKGRGVVAGYFDDHQRLAEAALRWDGKAEAIYVTLNPINPALLARSANRLSKNIPTASDVDVLCRKWLPIDLDPTRPSGISSTDEEHEAAIQRAREIREWLGSLGWPLPILGDSGNGAHLLYRIDLPNDENSRDLIQRLLRVLDLKFSDETVRVDTTTYNAARIWKLYGTMVCKGDELPDRPHRRSKLIEVPEKIEVVTLEQLQKLAGLLPKEPAEHARHSGEFDIEEWIKEHGLEIRKIKSWQGGTVYELAQCPFNPEHNRGEAFIFKMASGAIGFRCFHNSCADKDWHALRDLLEPGWRERKKPQPSPQKKKKGKPAITGEKRAEFLRAIAANCVKRGYDKEKILKVVTEQNKKCDPPLSESEIALIVENAVPKLQTITASELAHLDLAEPKWVVEGLIPEGLTVLAGRPKLGKSFMVLNFAAAVAVGGKALGCLDVSQTGVLLIGLEDSLKRIHDRLQLITGGQLPSNLHITTEMPRLGTGGLKLLSQWLDEHPEVSFVIIDPLAKVKPVSRKPTFLYDEDYGVIGDLREFAAKRSIALLLVHHTRKAEADYILDEVSGSTGITGAADTIMVLKRSTRVMILHVTGRDVETQELAVKFEPRLGLWTVLGEASEYRMSEERREIVELLKEAEEPMSPKEIAEAIGKPKGNVRFLLSKLVGDGVVERVGYGRYQINCNAANTANTANTANGLESVSEALAVVNNTTNTFESKKPSSHAGSCESVSGVSSVSGMFAKCPTCGSTRWWISIHGQRICAVCHPPASEKLVARWIEFDEEGTEDER